MIETKESVAFKKGDFVVYPAHGVGQITEIDTKTIGGSPLTVYAIEFKQDRLRLMVPVMKAKSAGLRKVSSTDHMNKALEVLKGRAKAKRLMWSRRAQEYETKINSGNPVHIAEVLRDLKKANDDTEQSYSERQIYESALERLAREVAAVQKKEHGKVVKELEKIMGVVQKAPVNDDLFDAEDGDADVAETKIAA